MKSSFSSDFVIIGETPPVTTHIPQPFTAHQTPLSLVLVGLSSRDRWGRWVSRKLQEKGLSSEESDVVRALEAQLGVVVRTKV
jgi:hypothetical protein